MKGGVYRMLTMKLTLTVRQKGKTSIDIEQ